MDKDNRFINVLDDMVAVKRIMRIIGECDEELARRLRYHFRAMHATPEEAIEMKAMYELLYGKLSG